MAKKISNTASPVESASLEINQESMTNLPAQYTSQIPMQVVDMSTGSIPDLDDAQEVPIDLMSDYWTPENPGEHKRVYFDCLKEREVKDFNDENITTTLLCAFFYEKEKDKPAHVISNGSKRLVGLLENLNIQRGTPLLITYLGKKKNTKNNFKSDIWSVKPLIVKVK